MNTHQLVQAVPGKAPRAIRVFIAEDHQITLWGLQQLVDASRPRMEVVGTACSHGELMNHDASGDKRFVSYLDVSGHQRATRYHDAISQRAVMSDMA